MDSILTSIKKLLGIDEDDTSFDTDVIIHINSAFFDLKRLGVGPSTGFSISDESATWNNFLLDNTDVNAVMTYIYLKVKLIFDASTLSSSYVATIKEMIKEYEWLLNVSAESTKTSE